MPVVSTEEMLAACRTAVSGCDGLIAVAAPCDYRPVQVAGKKISKTGQPLHAGAGGNARHRGHAGRPDNVQWMVAFALETKTGTCGRCRSSRVRVAT